MSTVEVRFLGTGDAFGSGGRHQTSSLLRSDGHSVMVDFGPASLALLRNQQIEPEQVETIAVTHLHGDHFGGLPFFLMDAHYATRRTRDLCLAGPPGLEQQLQIAHAVLFPGTGPLPIQFRLTFVEWEADRRYDFGACQITPILVKHSPSMPCYGLRVEFGGRVLAFSGDTEWAETLPALSRDADLFLCECFGYDWAPPGHLTYQSIEAHAAELTSRRTILTHMGEEMLRRRPGLDREFVHDGMTVVL